MQSRRIALGVNSIFYTRVKLYQWVWQHWRQGQSHFLSVSARTTDSSMTNGDYLLSVCIMECAGLRICWLEVDKCYTADEWSDRPDQRYVLCVCVCVCVRIVYMLCYVPGKNEDVSIMARLYLRILLLMSVKIIPGPRTCPTRCLEKRSFVAQIVTSIIDCVPEPW